MGPFFSWYFPWTPLDEADQLIDGAAGAATYESRFTDCMRSVDAPGDAVLTEPGAMVGPTNRGFDAIYASDPEMYWNSSPTGPTAPANGRKSVTLTNLGPVFVEQVRTTAPRCGKVSHCVRGTSGHESGNKLEYMNIRAPLDLRVSGTTFARNVFGQVRRGGDDANITLVVFPVVV